MSFPTSLLLDWYSTEKRDLPWRKTYDPYKIWVSEIFLQQTQVSRVIVYYERFLERFPTLLSLSKSSWEEFLPYFQGMGFYSRGRNMLKAAQYIAEKYSGTFPNDLQELQNIPGIGKYTAAAIASFAYHQSVPAVDTNFIRVFSRFFGISTKEVQKKGEEVYAEGNGNALNHAVMDLGSSLCTAKKVDCVHCPLKNQCHFFQTQQEIPLRLPSRPRRILEEERALLVLHRDKEYVFQKNNGEEILSLPSFLRPKGKDIRHLLQEKALQKWNIHISVRPPFFTVDMAVEKGLLRISFSRAQILQGEKPKGENFIWIPPEKLEENFYDEYTQKIIEKLKNMKMPK
ncbi:MAG: hypothetical protein WCJ84_03315 [Candidatus Peregrinibacteria bacterium]